MELPRIISWGEARRGLRGQRPGSPLPPGHRLDGKILRLEQLESVGTFDARKRGWSTVWGLVPLHANEFSRDLNEQVEQVNGEAVVRLKITSTESGINLWFIINWIPIWPGCVRVHATGVIVRRPKVGTASFLAPLPFSGKRHTGSGGRSRVGWLSPIRNSRLPRRRSLQVGGDLLEEPRDVTPQPALHRGVLAR